MGHLLRDTRAQKDLEGQRWMDSEDDLPNAQVETFSEGEQSNEHTATLTETEASKEASNTAGERVLF